MCLVTLFMQGAGFAEIFLLVILLNLFMEILHRDIILSDNWHQFLFRVLFCQLGAYVSRRCYTFN